MSDDLSKEAASINPGADGQSFEINVKTLENQVHKVRVTKNMSVAELKEKIVDITRVSVEDQRLIFRGRVLNDDQPLSNYHVEEGHTLHMVVRRPTDGQSAPGSTSADANRNTGNDSNANGQRTRPGQAPRNVIFGVNVTETGEEMTDQIVRGIGDMLRSLSSGLMTPGGMVGNNQPSANAGSGPEQEGSQNANNRAQSVNSVQPGFAVLNHQIQVSSMPPAALLPRNMVISDSVTTLSEFMHRMEAALQSSGSGEIPSQPPTRPEALPLNQRGVPTPQALASVIAQARQLLTGSFASSLSQFVQHLERDAGSTDGPARQAIQSEAIQAGISMQHLGAMLLELGRTTMTLRMGSSPEESVVNSGPSVYLNANGPNPIMVQPFPLQTSSLLGGGQIISGVVGPFSSTIGTAVPPSNSTASETPVDPNAVPTHPSGDPHPIRSLAPGGIVRQPVGPGGHLLSVVYPVQVRAPTSGGQLRASAPQSSQNAQSSFQSVGTGGISSLMQQINAQLNNVLSGFPPGQVNIPGQVNVSDQGTTTNTTGGVEGNVGGTDDTPPRTSEQVSVSGNMRARSLSRQDASLVRSGTENKVDEHSTDKTGSVNNTVASTSSDTMQSPQSNQGSETSTPAPLGLGLAGLQPKKKSKASAKPTRDGPSQSPPVENQTPQLNFQSLLSQISSISNSSQMQSAAPQSQAPPQRADLGNMFSQLLQSPAINNLMNNMASQSGMGSPSELRNVMEQCTRDPAMQNIFGDLVQQIDRQRVTGQSGPNAGGGIDLSRIVQQMMPVVSSVLGVGGSGQPSGSSPSMTVPSSSVQTDEAREVLLQQACERIEQRDSASNIFTSVMEGTGLHQTADADFTTLINALSTNSDLANEYMNVLHEEICKRLQSDLGMGNRE